MTDWKEGMIVTVKRQCSECYPGKHYVLRMAGAELKADNGKSGGCTCYENNWVLVSTEVNKMELNEIKKANLTEAAKQVAAEKMNAEIAFAKQKFVEAQNRVDELDRQIKQAGEAKKPYLEILAKFK